MTQVSDLKTSNQLGFPDLKLSESNRVVIQLVRSLPGPLQYRYHLFTDNFFTTTTCMTALRTLYVAHSGTCKAQSGYPSLLLAIRDKAKKKHDWGKQASMCIDDRILCLAWVDNNTVQYMTTAHAPSKVNETWWMDPAKRHRIPSTSQKIIPEEDKVGLLGDPDPRIKWPKGLPVPTLIHEYNCNMNGIDRIAQMVSYYQDERRSRRYWISLFEFFLMAAVVNAYRIYTIDCCNKNDKPLSHLEFQRSVAITLLEHYHSRRRIHPCSQLVDQKPPEPKHHWQKLSKKSYCRPCLTRKTAAPTNIRTQRKALGEVSGNVTKKQRARPPQVNSACSACQVPCCRRNPNCWKELHTKSRIG